MSEPPGAIAFTDIVGFTQLTAEHGDDFALHVLERQDALVRKMLPGDARVVKELGDGLLLWFAHPAPALATCLALQQRFASEASIELPLWVRIGVHWGAPRRRGDDLVGHVVNLASRIAETAAPGEVLASEDLVDVLGRSDHQAGGFSFDELGPVFVKGIVEPVRLYRVTVSG